MLSIINAALLAHGQESVAENDGSEEWRVCSSQWPTIVEAELEDGNYRFSKEEVTVTAYSSGKFGYDNAYQVPATALYVRNVWAIDSAGNRYDIAWCQDATHVHMTHNDGCVIEYVLVPDESVFTANFAAGVKSAMEAVILRSLKEEYAEAREFDDKALYFFQRARSKSSNARSKDAPYRDTGSIISARFRRG